MSSIRLSPKHGLNPSAMQCFYCGDDIGVAVPGLLKGDRKAPRKAVWDMTPCDKCTAVMKIGVIFCEIDNDLTKDRDNPYRTGRLIALSEEGVRHLIGNQEKLEQLLKQRFCWIGKEEWEAVGFNEMFEQHKEMTSAKPN